MIFSCINCQNDENRLALSFVAVEKLTAHLNVWRYGSFERLMRENFHESFHLYSTTSFMIDIEDWNHPQ